VSRFGVVIPAGPSPQEFDRIVDVMTSLHHFEPGVTRVVIVNDEHTGRDDLMAAAGPLADRTTIIENPRDPAADGWSEGVLVGIASGLQELVRSEPDLDWVLRMDSDALAIAPFDAAVSERFASDPTIGMVGTYLHDIDGTPRDFGRTGVPVRRLHMPISLWKAQRTVKTSLVGIGRQRNRVIDAARRRGGYQWGEHCQGGAYGLSMAAVRAVADEGWLDCELWKGSYVSEDLIMSIQILALGYRMEGMSSPGEPFAVRHVGLSAPPRALHDAGYAIVHSLKGNEGRSEDEVREEFRALRS
jgi:hypothetical protein